MRRNRGSWSPGRRSRPRIGVSMVMVCAFRWCVRGSRVTGPPHGVRVGRVADTRRVSVRVAGDRE